MKKPKIYATGNETLNGNFNISYYIIEKEESFLDWLGDLLVSVFDMEQGRQQAKFIIKTDEDGNEELIQKRLSEMIDIHEHYESKRERVDIFYGANRVYITFRKSRELRKKFADFVMKTKEWIEVKEINPESKKVFNTE